jgi:hypothetical protein
MFNALKVSPYLYERYQEYEYILFYEPDAFVFSDDLLSWCATGFDYIGAPWFKGFGAIATKELIGVGNGGFSLRKVATHLTAAKRFEFERLLVRGSVKQLRHKLDYLRDKLWRSGKEAEVHYMAPIDFHEDVFWGKSAARRYRQFRVAPISVALSFSFEVNPAVLFQMNGYRLPFGCHAWFKHDISFWVPHIEKFGYSVPRSVSDINLSG